MRPPTVPVATVRQTIMTTEAPAQRRLSTANNRIISLSVRSTVTVLPVLSCQTVAIASNNSSSSSHRPKVSGRIPGAEEVAVVVLVVVVSISKISNRIRTRQPLAAPPFSITVLPLLSTITITVAALPVVRKRWSMAPLRRSTTRWH